MTRFRERMGGLPARLRSRATTSPVAAAVLTLMSGTAVAQVVTFVLQIFIARIYTDVDKGLFGVYGSITSFVITFAALRYDLALMLPKDDVVARVLHRLATRAILVTSLLTSLACLLGAHWLREHYHHSEQLQFWLIASGVTVFLVAQGANLQYWLTRKGRFAQIASTSVVRSLAVAGMQLLAGLAAHGGLSALVIGTITGQLVTLVFIRTRTPDAREVLPPTAPTMREVARTYRRMPLLNGPNAIVDSLRNTGINLLIGAVAIAALGQFQLAWAVMQVPVALVAGAVGQVFLKKLSDTERGHMRPLVNTTLVRAALVAAPPFLALYVLAPWLFPLLFGDQWVQAGLFARALTPWLFMTVLTSPVSNLFVVTHTQARMLGFALLYCAAPLAWLWATPLDLLATVTVLGFLMAGLLAIMVLMALWTATQFDRGRTPSAPSGAASDGGEQSGSRTAPGWVPDGNGEVNS